MGELGLIGTKDMRGICYVNMELLGCSARLHGSTLEVNLYPVEDGCIIQARCVKCDDCYEVTE